MKNLVIHHRILTRAGELVELDLERYYPGAYRYQVSEKLAYNIVKTGKCSVRPWELVKFEPGKQTLLAEAHTLNQLVITLFFMLNFNKTLEV